MRLIDADKVIEVMRNKLDMQELYLPIHLKELVIDEMPTVIDMNEVIKKITSMEEKAVKRACEARRSGNNDKVAHNDGKTVAYGAVKEIIGNEWMG